MSYDAEHRLAAVEDPDGNVTTIERDGAGAPTAIVGPFGQRTALTVDADGYLATLESPGGEVHELTHGPSGLLESMRDPSSRLTLFGFDAAGRLLTDQDAAGGGWTLTRTDHPVSYLLGWTVTATSAEGRVRVYAREQLDEGRSLRTTTRPDGLVHTLRTSTDGTSESESPNGALRTRRTTADPRLGAAAPFVSSTREEQPSGLTTTTTATRAVTLSDPLDPLSLETMDETVSLNGRPYTRHYDQSTRTMTLTSPTGRQSSAVLDSRGRLTSAQMANLAPTSVAYDSRGRVSTVTTGTGPTARTSTTTYGADGFVETTTDTLGRTHQYERDAAGRVIRHVMPDLREVLYAYDEAGNVTSITPPSRPAHTFLYTPVDLVESYTPPDLGPGLELTQYDYDLDRNLTHVELPDGRMVDYDHDAAGRLDQVREDSIVVADYAYDDNGNRSSVTRPGGTVSGTYDAQDRVLTYGTHTYVHNANGDLVSRTDTATSATTTLLYDEMGALLQATLPDGRVIDYLIDAQNRRIGKRVGGILERAWLYDEQLRPAAELDGAGNVVSVFVHAAGPAGGAPAYMVRGGVLYRFLTDHVGSPRLVVNAATGVLAQRMDFDEFGRVLAHTNPGWQPFGFAGGLWDPDTRLVRFGARDYDAETGRWTTKDPIGFAGGDANLYGYVLGIR